MLPSRVVVGPAEEPVTLEEAKAHLRVEHGEEDGLIGAYIRAARELVEARTWRALVTQTREVSLGGWPAGREIELPRPPLQGVVWVKWRNGVGEEETLGPGLYVVDTAGEPGRLALAEGASWPNRFNSPPGGGGGLAPVNGITVRFTAGYGGAGDVPQVVKQAMLFLVGHFYENREAAVVQPGVTATSLPLAVDALLWTVTVR